MAVSNITLKLMANVITKEQMDSTQKVEMIMFHSPLGLEVI